MNTEKEVNRKSDKKEPKLDKPMTIRHCHIVLDIKPKVNPGSSFKQSLMGPGPQCYIPKFMEIGPLAPEKKSFKGFTIYGCGGHLGHASSIILIPKSLHTKFG